MEEWNKGKASFTPVIDEIFATTVVFHGWFYSDYGLKEFNQNNNDFFSAFQTFIGPLMICSSNETR